jgi:cell division protein FtsW (lipid II flippase)
MSKRGYLPECSTDFVYSVVCEEMGLAGAALVTGLLLTWLVLVRRAAVGAGDRLGALLAAGVGFSIILQAVLHIAVNLALFPTTGQPLPFVSSGGTALLTNAAATAIVLSVTTYRGREAVDQPEALPATA